MIMPNSLRWLVLTGCAISLAPGAAPGQGAAPTESQVKAAFLYNFANFVEWPEADNGASTSSVVFCVIGETPVAADLDAALRGRKIHNREPEVRRFRSLRELGGCQVLFVSAEEGPRLRQILGATEGLAMLTVGETERFAKMGGMVNFYTEESRVRFEINVEETREVGLSVSSRLLRLARLVETEGGEL